VSPGTGGDPGADATINDPKWSCLKPPITVPQAPNPAKAPVVSYVVPVVDYANLPNSINVGTAFVPGLSILLCQATDYSCTNPIYPATDPLVHPDPMRPFLSLLKIPFNLDVFLRINADKYVQLEYYTGGNIIGSQTGDPMLVGDAIPILSIATVDDFLTRGMKPSPHDPKKGILAARTVDCNAKRTSGVRVRRLNGSDPGAYPYTLLSNIPIFQDDLPTDDRGVAGWANLAPDTFQIEGVLADGTTYGAVGVAIRANQITEIDIRPAAVVPQ
jgi:hypothetical protein